MGLQLTHDADATAPAAAAATSALSSSQGGWQCRLHRSAWQPPQQAQQAAQAQQQHQEQQAAARGGAPTGGTALPAATRGTAAPQQPLREPSEEREQHRGGCPERVGVERAVAEEAGKGGAAAASL
jgi:hypothetical protein